MTVIINAASMSGPQLMSQVSAKLKAHRSALQELENTFKWLSAYAPADFVAQLGLSTDDAQSLFDSVTDAHNEYVNYANGIPGALPPPGYKYGASQTEMIGNA